MEKEVYNLIKENNLFKPGEVVGVAVSGGVDSMSLLHFLATHSEDLDISVVAITVDHMLRGEDSLGDALFVKTYCSENKIQCWKFAVDAGLIAERKKIGVEEAARIARYGVFDRLIEENKVDKIALAHHLSDQAETILMHILRGSGLNGACGMEVVKDGSYVRPFLETSRDEIENYALINNIEHVEDATNQDSSFNRNFLRNKIFPQLKKRWEGVERNLINFSKACREDNDFILGHVRHDGVIIIDSLAKIPLLYFHYEPSIINRIIFDALNKIGITQDIERKHIKLIKELENSENGKKINLPNDLIAQREYDYITLYKVATKVVAENYAFKVGKINFADLYEINVKRTKKLEMQENSLLVDSNKIPETAVWRTRKTGDKITKFGGGTKTLKSYLINKKVPSRLRDTLPVLAVDNEILCVLGLDISDNVKVDENTKTAYRITKIDLKNK